MRRRQLFEFLDQHWCPRVLRDGATDCLEAIIAASDPYQPIRADFVHAIQTSGTRRVVDLCSGGGGPWLSRPWLQALRDLKLPVVLTDKFPSRALPLRLQAQEGVTAVSTSVDATRVPGHLDGFRTIFSSFHHFPDEMAQRMLSDAVAHAESIASAEVTSRSAYAFCFMFLMPALAWWVTPGIRPFRWTRLLFTYLLPAIPLILWWDGMVSCLRTRTPDEMLALTKPFPEYRWRAGYGKVKIGRLAPLYLIGCNHAIADEYTQPGPIEAD